MAKSKTSLILGCLIGLVAWIAAPVSGFANPAPEASAWNVVANTHFVEPLVQVGPTSDAETIAASQAVSAYEHRSTPDDVSDLTTYIARYPRSGWDPALLTNLGFIYLHDGYFSRAIDAWRQAWELGKSATGVRARALVDRALGEQMRLYTSLGQFDHVSALFHEMGSRRVSGSATEEVQLASEQLALVTKDPRHLFNCGPVGLRALMLQVDPKDKRGASLQWYRAGPNGTNLAELAGLADKAQFPYRIVERQAGQPVPVPSLIHWKVGHFSTVVGEANGRYHIKDLVFPGDGLWVTKAALDAESSGYFLVPAEASKEAAWRNVTLAEAGRVWGKGPTSGTLLGDAWDVLAHAFSNTCPMCGYDMKEATVGLTLSDQPVGYASALGPSPVVTINYNQREDSQPANFTFFNVSQKWTLNWLSYITDDPCNPGANVSRYLPGGGAYYETSVSAVFEGGGGGGGGGGASTAPPSTSCPPSNGYSGPITYQFLNEYGTGAILVPNAQNPTSYTLQMADGSQEVYAQSNGAAAFPRNIFLSQVIDPQGNTLTLTYDSQMRLTALTDATGRQTTFSYGNPDLPLQVTQITDPFGRSAALAYDINGRLASITDILGLTSTFTYDANSLVNSMTTPYGTSTFAYTAPGTSGPPRFVQATDPLGYNERMEWLEPAPIPDSDPTSTVPQGMPNGTTNQYLTYRDTFYWDRNAYIAAKCAPSGGCDYTKAKDTHFLHVAGTNIKSTTVESVKLPLENRIWYNYLGQNGSIYTGGFSRPTAAGRVLDDGTTQFSQSQYGGANNGVIVPGGDGGGAAASGGGSGGAGGVEAAVSTGYLKLTQTIDPLGRSTVYNYASNNIDLTSIQQFTSAGGAETTIAQFSYNNQHLPTSAKDAAGKTTNYSYNGVGQITQIKNALGQTATYKYSTANDLLSITNANGEVAKSYTYDTYDRIATATDSEGYAVSYSYDNANRITSKSYPDGTTDRYTYKNLDLIAYKNRQAQVWIYGYDADRRRISTTAPDGATTLYAYTPTGKLATLTDAKGNVTQWAYDIEGRLLTQQYADKSTTTYTYENTTSRLKSVQDALGQTKQYTYAEDNKTLSVSYVNAVNPTPNVSYTYDPYYSRIATMTDGTGTTAYTYVPVGNQGALKLQQVTSPLADSAVRYSYDALGRPIRQTVAGAGAQTFQYDALGRLISDSNDLGTFALGYLGQTGQITSRQLQGAGATLATSWSYQPNSGDRRLAGISNVGLTSNQFSTYAYTATPLGQISGMTESSDAAPVYPQAGTQSISYTALNQVASLGPQAYAYDADGNLLSDGQRSYSWDAENRLIAIAYPGQTGKATAFTYDGLGRRVAITSTPAGGGAAVSTAYIWCGQAICQARTAAGAVSREYVSEGELVPGAAAQPYYYGIDQIGSVRRAFASAVSAPAYAYDPYGAPLQTTAPVTDFGYAGLFYNADSGLYLANHRAYDPATGRWLSRDPLGEAADARANLYGYVGANPISGIDPSGLFCIPFTNIPFPNLFPDLYDDKTATLLETILLTEILGGGPENPVADLLVLDEIEGAWAGLGAEADAAVAVETAGGTYSAIGSTGQVGEAALKELGGESQVYFNSNLGGRYVDQLVDGVANESKVGYQTLTSTNQLQIMKDVDLIQSGQINGSTWHFFTSPVTGAGGPSAPLANFLTQNGIKIVVH